MIAKWKLIWSPILAVSVAALSMLSAGCGGGAAAPSPSQNAAFSSEERAAMKKSVRSPAAYKQLLKIKTLESEGLAKVKYPATTGQSRRN